MKYYQNLSREVRFFLWFLVCFILIAVLVKLDKVSTFDRNIIHVVQSAESPVLTILAKGLSFIGSFRMVLGISILTMALLYIGFKKRLELILFLWVGLGSQLLNILMKLWFHRERPDFNRLIDVVGYSFPSGHSMAAFSLYGLIAYLLWWHFPYSHQRIFIILFAVIMTLSIGFSRIYLGVHYPSDVIGGYAASGAWLMLCVSLFKTYQNKRGVYN